MTCCLPGSSPRCHFEGQEYPGNEVAMKFTPQDSLAQVCIHNLVERFSGIRFSHMDVKLTIFFSDFHQVLSVFVTNFNCQCYKLIGLCL